MPETSQDAFETLFPPKQPISAHELRERSNSMTKKRGQSNPKNSLKIRVDNPLVAAESNFWPPTPTDPASLAVAATGGGNGATKGGVREARISVGELDSCYTTPEPIGYKRESSHRYAFPHFSYTHFCRVLVNHQTKKFNLYDRFWLIFLLAAVSMSPLTVIPHTKNNAYLRM